MNIPQFEKNMILECTQCDTFLSFVNDKSVISGEAISEYLFKGKKCTNCGGRAFNYGTPYVIKSNNTDEIMFIGHISELQRICRAQYPNCGTCDFLHECEKGQKYLEKQAKKIFKTQKCS